MKILVTGARGMLAQDIYPILTKEGHNVIMTDRAALDITNEKTVNETVLKVKPDVIINCAAYTNVDKAEKEYEKAYDTNVAGAKNLAIAAEKINATLVHISTDYVFDGKKTTPYLITDEPNPINLYGKTKYLGEIEVQKHCKKHYIVRSSWLYGQHGKNFVETMINLAHKNIEIKVVNDQKGSPTWTIDLIYGILKILNMPYGIYQLSNEGETTWYEFAKKIFELENLNVDLKPCSTDEYKRDAKRPKYSYMDNNKLLRNWSEALKDYLKIRKETK